MANETSSAFNSAANPTPPGNGPSGGDAPPVTPSEQVARHAPTPDGPSPPPGIGEAVKSQTHYRDMQRDGNQSDQANNYTRSQSPASVSQIQTLGALFAKQAALKKEKQKQQEQAKNNQQNKGRERDD